MRAMAVLFDLDGVLIDSRAAFLNSMTPALADLGLGPFTREELLPCIGPPLKVGFSALLATEPDDPRVDALIAAYRGHYATISLTDTTVVPGIPEALTALDEPLAVATSKPRRFAEPLLEALGLREHFSVVAGPELDARGEFQGPDHHPCAGRARHGPGRDGRRPLLRRGRRPRERHPLPRRAVGHRLLQGARASRRGRDRRRPA
jgi:phosphoglycolate phosphatase